MNSELINDSNGHGMTEVERLEEALRLSQISLNSALKEADQLRAALDAHAIVAITDARGRITFVNDRFCSISKYKREELIGEDHRIINSGHHSKEFIRGLWETIRNGKVWHGEIKNRAKDGTFYWVDTTIVPFFDGDGNPDRYVAIRADITERKLAEECLKASLKEVNALKDALDEHAIVAITDPRGKITYVNDKFCSISKYSRQELLGQDHRIINSGHHPRSFIERLWTTLSEGTVWHGEIKNRAKDGTFYGVDTTIVPFLNESGKPYQYVAIRADITERKRVEESLCSVNENLEVKVLERTAELQVAKEKAEEAVKVKSEFLANMSHELRTPLNGIIGFSEFLADGKPGPLNPKQAEYLGDILNSGRHLLQLINDLLDLSKIEAGKMELTPEDFCLDEVVHEVCGVIRPLAERKKIEIQISIDATLGQVSLDPQKFKQVIYNLLSNAVKFTNEGGRVDLQAAVTRPGYFKISVRDTGIGIKAEDIPRLFTEFEQLESGAARRFEGTGLGLALTRKITEWQGGSVAVESIPGEGSNFEVELPIQAQKATQSDKL
ncbi:MAG: sensor histidine kinase [Verrucomicrobiales bacterium]|nr:sensor histidine kinase [Verrucomicrobiales bacterium]